MYSFSHRLDVRPLKAIAVLLMLDVSLVEAFAVLLILDVSLLEAVVGLRLGVCQRLLGVGLLEA